MSEEKKLIKYISKVLTMMTMINIYNGKFSDLWLMKTHITM